MPNLPNVIAHIKIKVINIIVYPATSGTQRPRSVATGSNRESVISHRLTTREREAFLKVNSAILRRENKRSHTGDC